MSGAATLARLARLAGEDPAAAEAELLRCCGSRAWARAVVARRPFGSEDELRAAAMAAFDDLGDADWSEAFAAHPRLGSRADVAAKSAATRAWSSAEQSGTAAAGAELLAELAAANAAYEARFGFVFLLCATGKSAEAMLAACRERLGHDIARERAIAAGEQKKITELRLAKLLGE